jgi:ketosteroid isomerase-like protein
MKQLINSFLKASSLFLVMAFIVFSGCQQQPDYSKELKPIFDKYFEIWEKPNLDVLDAIMDPNFVRHADAGTSAKSRDELKKAIAELKNNFSDIKVVSEEEIYTENKFAGRWTMTATHIASGKPIKQWGNNIIHFKDGKIVEEWDSFDNLPLMEQLGFTVMPPAAEKK